MRHRGSNPGEQEMGTWYHPEVHPTNPTQERGELGSLDAGIAGPPFSHTVPSRADLENCSGGSSSPQEERQRAG